MSNFLMDYSPGFLYKQIDDTTSLDIDVSADNLFNILVDPFFQEYTSDDFYNYWNLNKIENNTLEVANYLTGLMYNMPIETTKTDRTISSIDFLSSLNRVERNIDCIKSNFLTPEGWQAKKTWSVGYGFDYNEANRYENNLYLLYTWAQIAKDNLIYSGTFSCGTNWEGVLYA